MSNELMKPWFLGSLNDGLFIVNRRPTPCGTDLAVGTPNPDPATLVLNITELPDAKAQAIVDAHNALLSTLPAAGGGVEAVAWLRRQADRAYYDYIVSTEGDLSKGEEIKLTRGTYGPDNLAAHRKSAELLGAHRAYADAARYVASATPPSPPVAEAVEAGVRKLIAEWEDKGRTLPNINEANAFTARAFELHDALLAALYPGAGA